MVRSADSQEADRGLFFQAATIYLVEFAEKNGMPLELNERMGVTENENKVIGRVKQNSAFDHAQNEWIHIILHMRKVSSGHLPSTEIFYSIKCFC